MPRRTIDFGILQWSENAFELERRGSTIVLTVHGLRVGNDAPRALCLCFEDARSEWAMLWDSVANQWKSHPHPEAPIGTRIVEAFAKPSGIGTLLSFAGNHELGWSRWGFAASAISEC